MAQIIPGTPGFGASFGEGLGQGLQALAQHKLNQVLERQSQKRDADNLQSAGFTPQESKFLASQPAQLRPSYIQQLRPYGSAGQSNAQQLQQQSFTPQQQQQASLEEIMSSLRPIAPNNKAQQALSGVQGSSGEGYLSRLLGSQFKQPSSMEPRISIPTPMSRVQPQQEATPSLKSPTVAESLTAQRASPKAHSASDLREQSAINKEQRKITHDTVKSINDSYKAAKESDIRLDRMQKLVDSGKLNRPELANLVKGFKIPFTSTHIGLPQNWLTPESQEFDKLSTDFVKGAKNVFGSRMTQGEVDLFLKTVPSLTNSDEGKKVLIRNLKLMNDAVKVKKNALDAIREANGGTYPANLDELVEEVAGPRLEQIKDQFVSGGLVASDEESKSLPSISEYTAGDMIENPATGHTFELLDGKWSRVK